MSEKTYYCHLDSGGEVDTNLQLYFLKKADSEWVALSICYEQDGNNIKNLKERLVSIVSNLGLSLSQLLGQNATQIKVKLDTPDRLLSTFLNESDIDREQKRSLNKQFDHFIKYYDACRHFGRVEGDVKWEIVDSLSYDLVGTFMETTLKIWDTVIDIHRAESFEASNVEEILQYVRFNEEELEY